MKKTSLTRRISEKEVLEKTRVTDDESDLPGFIEYRRYEFIRELADNPSLLMCGSVNYQKLNIFHNGKEWIAEAEAVIQSESFY